MAQVIKVTPSQGEDEKLMSMGKQVASMAQSQGGEGSGSSGSTPGMEQASTPKKVESASSNPRDRYMQKKQAY